MPQLIVTGTISCVEFQQRLKWALDNYAEFCRIMRVDRNSHPPIEWLDHFQEFLSLAELEKRKNSS